MNKYFPLLLVLTACSADHSSTYDHSTYSSDFSTIENQIQNQRNENRKAYDQSQLQKALRTLSLRFYQRFPKTQEREAIKVDGYIAYKKWVDELMESDQLLGSYKIANHKIFKMFGTKDRINNNEPTNLTLYLFKNDLDYRQVMTAKYCIDDDLKQISCSSFKNTQDQQQEAAGVITTQSFLLKWISPFNFMRVAQMFEGFACRPYPDVDDVGIAKDQIVAELADFKGAECIGCHKSLNPRASLFYKFDRSGTFNRSPASNVATQNLTGAVSTTDDIITDQAQYIYNNVEIRSLAEFTEVFVQSRLFHDCFVQKHINFALGRDYQASTPKQMSYFYERPRTLNFRPKTFLKEVFLSQEFIAPD